MGRRLAWVAAQEQVSCIAPFQPTQPTSAASLSNRSLPKAFTAPARSALGPWLAALPIVAAAALLGWMRAAGPRQSSCSQRSGRISRMEQQEGAVHASGRPAPSPAKKTLRVRRQQLRLTPDACVIDSKRAAVRGVGRGQAARRGCVLARRQRPIACRRGSGSCANQPIAWLVCPRWSYPAQRGQRRRRRWARPITTDPSNSAGPWVMRQQQGEDNQEHKQQGRKGRSFLPQSGTEGGSSTSRRGEQGPPLAATGPAADGACCASLEHALTSFVCMRQVEAAAPRMCWCRRSRSAQGGRRRGLVGRGGPKRQVLEKQIQLSPSTRTS